MVEEREELLNLKEGCQIKAKTEDQQTRKQEVPRFKGHEKTKQQLTLTNKIGRIGSSVKDCQ